MHKSFTMLKWCRSSWPTPHGDDQVVMVTTWFWWHWTKCPRSFYCITFSEVPMLWPNLCNQVVKLTTWSCTTEVRGRCKKNQRTNFVRWFSGIPRCSPSTAMYASTPVRTYIAKRPKRAIYAILYSTEVVWIILIQAARFRSSSHFENLISVLSSSFVKKLSTLSPINISWSFWPTEKQVILSQEQISKLKSR